MARKRTHGHVGIHVFPDHLGRDDRPHSRWRPTSSRVAYPAIACLVHEQHTNRPYLIGGLLGSKTACYRLRDQFFLSPREARASSWGASCVAIPFSTRA